MEVIKLAADNNIKQEQIIRIAGCLKSGSVIAYPTDTIYGLGCDPKNIQAIKRINKIKGEKGKKAMIVLVSDLAMLRCCCFIGREQENYLKKIWFNRPGTAKPVTVILKRKPNLPVELTGGLNSLAVRLPNNEFLISLINRAGFPLVSTSLNKKGEKPLFAVSSLEKYFKYLPDLVIDAGVLKGKPSKLIDLRDVKNIKVIRK